MRTGIEVMVYEILRYQIMKYIKESYRETTSRDLQHMQQRT